MQRTWRASLTEYTAQCPGHECVRAFTSVRHAINLDIILKESTCILRPVRPFWSSGQKLKRPAPGVITSGESGPTRQALAGTLCTRLCDIAVVLMTKKCAMQRSMLDVSIL